MSHGVLTVDHSVMPDEPPGHLSSRSPLFYSLFLYNIMPLAPCVYAKGSKVCGHTCSHFCKSSEGAFFGTTSPTFRVHGEGGKGSILKTPYCAHWDVQQSHGEVPPKLFDAVSWFTRASPNKHLWGKKQDVQTNMRRMCIHFTLFGTSMQFNNTILVYF